MTTKNLIALSSLFVAASIGFADTPTKPTPPTGTPPTGTPPAGRPPFDGPMPPHTVNENASDQAKAVQGVLQKFDAQRDAMMAERKALLDKLQAAKTDAERKAILDQLKAEQKTNIDEQRALGKEIRAEMKKLRDAKAAPTK
jgi:hypothetical protein